MGKISLNQLKKDFERIQELKDPAVDDIVVPGGKKAASESGSDAVNRAGHWMNTGWNTSTELFQAGIRAIAGAPGCFRRIEWQKGFRSVLKFIRQNVIAESSDESEELMRLIQIIIEDPELYGQFEQLAGLAPAARKLTLQEFVRRSGDEMKDRRSSRILTQLQDPVVFEAVHRTVLKLRGN